MSYSFEWDPDKAAKNLKKHQVAFDEAATVFDNPLALIFHDVDHSVEEDRELMIGAAVSGRVLIVSFTERSEVIRIISARVATRKERRDYEENKIE